MMFISIASIEQLRKKVVSYLRFIQKTRNRVRSHFEVQNDRVRLSLNTNFRRSVNENQLESISFSKSKRVALWEDNGCLSYYVDLEAASHVYLHSDFLRCAFPPFLGSIDYLGYGDDRSVSAALTFYDDCGEKISGSIGPLNQVHTVEIPSRAKNFRISLRFSRDGRGVIHKFFLGDGAYLRRITNNFSSFNFSDTPYLIDSPAKKVEIIESLPLILLETVFCDTETNLHVLERYYSFFEALFISVISQSYSNFVWFIYISDDKSHYLERVQKK